MKKKIKDLTLEEKDKICAKNKLDCAWCPLAIVSPLTIECFKPYLEKEVEVDVEEN